MRQATGQRRRCAAREIDGTGAPPFAFAGTKYDPVLLRTYTQTTDKDIFRKRNITAPLFKDAMANSRPMGRLVEQNITRELLDDIAAEFARGRLMFLGATNLDSREPVYWNMGALASSQDPAALELFHKITLASAAIPGAFPPVMIEVTVDGQSYQEMHVDGGATRQVFLHLRRVHLAEFTRQHGDEPKRTLYIIRNSRLDPEWASVDRVVAETGLGFAEWRQRVRLTCAAVLLTPGASVTQAGLDVGYASTSAFVAAFRRAFGCTPAEFRARGQQPERP